MGDFWIIRVAPQCDAYENLQKVFSCVKTCKRFFQKLFFPLKFYFSKILKTIVEISQRAHGIRNLILKAL